MAGIGIFGISRWAAVHHLPQPVRPYSVIPFLYFWWFSILILFVLLVRSCCCSILSPHLVYFCYCFWFVVAICCCACAFGFSFGWFVRFVYLRFFIVVRSFLITVDGFCALVWVCLRWFGLTYLYYYFTVLGQGHLLPTPATGQENILSSLPILLILLPRHTFRIAPYTHLAGLTHRRRFTLRVKTRTGSFVLRLLRVIAGSLFPIPDSSWTSHAGPLRFATRVCFAGYWRGALQFSWFLFVILLWYLPFPTFGAYSPVLLLPHTFCAHYGTLVMVRFVWIPTFWFRDCHTTRL